MPDHTRWTEAAHAMRGARPVSAGTAMVETVRGPVPATELGHVAFHEHLLCDLRADAALDADPALLSAEITLETVYDIRRFDVNLHNLVLDSVPDALEELERFRDAGGGTIVDLTTACFGRDPAALRALSDASGVHIVMGSGWYVHDFHGPQLHRSSRHDLTEQLLGEFHDGVEGVRPGVIGEVGLSWPVEPCEYRALAAAVAAQRELGCCLVVHPGRNAAAPQNAVDFLAKNGGDLQRVVISHIDRTLFDLRHMLDLAQTGVVLSFDLFGKENSHYPHGPIHQPNDGARIKFIKQLVDHGHPQQIVISQDICTKVHTRKWGGEGYGHILQNVIPQMRLYGLSDVDIAEMTTHTPARLLSGASA
jgi:phosphotriesterase-related protein